MRTAITLSLLLLTAVPVLAQRGGGDRGDRGDRGSGGGNPGGGGGGPGGFRGGGGNGMDADSSFNRLLASYGGTGDVVDYSKISQESRDRYNRFASFGGGQPMPVSGTITRAQYAEAYTKRMEAMRANGGGGFGRPGGGPPGAAPIAPPGVSVTVVPGGVAPAAPGAERTLPDDEIARMFRKMDGNDDGKISPDEARRSDRLTANFAYYDANKDGVIEVAEFKTYMLDRENKRGPAGESDNRGGGGNSGGGGPGGWNGGGGGGWDRGGGDGRGAPQAPVEEERAVAIRYGKLPTGLPSWWNDLDTDKDGQIGMYEWRAAKKPMEDFLKLDLNKDGLVTAEEYLRAMKLPISPVAEVKADAGNGGNGFRNRGNGGGGYGGGSNGNGGNGNGGDRRTKEDKKDSKEPKGNPFRN